MKPAGIAGGTMTRVSMSDIILYHNPRCSKSRAALEILRKRGVEPAIVEYLKTPPTAAELRDLLAKLGLRPRDVLRDGEPEYDRLRLADPARTDPELIGAIAAHPILLQRPIAVRGSRAIVGRPPERVAELL